MSSKRLDRRQFVTGTAVGAGILAASAQGIAQSHHDAAPTGPSLAASPPAGFTPMSAPGRVIRVNKQNSMRPGGLYPTMEAAATMVDRAMLELTGETTVAAAWRKFVHPSDRVGIKVNGIALRNFASNKETIIAIMNGVIAAGVPANQISIYDQYGGFLNSTRITRRDVPAGVALRFHSNTDVGRETRVASGRTQYATPLLDCTAVIGVPLIKDHSLSGFTGAMKNMTHGSIKNPQDFHRHVCSPQIAELFAHEAIRSRIRVHVMDGFKVMYDGGPLYHRPEACVPFEAVLASTDPVAMDRIGLEIVNALRAQHNLQSIEHRGDAPAYIEQAAALGLGISDRARIDLREINLT